MNKIYKIFETKYGGLIFSLLSGCAYFIIVLDLILKSTPSGGLLGFFFFPAIICGAGIVLLKTIKKLQAEEQMQRINIIVYTHIILMLISIVFLFDIILN